MSRLMDKMDMLSESGTIDTPAQMHHRESDKQRADHWWMNMFYRGRTDWRTTMMANTNQQDRGSRRSTQIAHPVRRLQVDLCYHAIRFTKNEEMLVVMYGVHIAICRSMTRL
jgi:hypothetical protein